MAKNPTRELYREIEAALTERSFLRQIGLSRRRMMTLLSDCRWREQAAELYERMPFSEKRPLSCADVEAVCRETLRSFADRPEEGWLQYTYDTALHFLFPHLEIPPRTEERDRAALFFNRVLYTALRFDARHRRFSPLRDFAVLREDEYSGCQTGAEYRRMLEIEDQHYIYEFMRIGAEITPFDTLGHVAGVHHVAMHAARQLYQLGAPVDPAMISAAAVCHDIGKFGCRPEEANRVPYLHYYYTDECLKMLGMPRVAHIASNHSTWDLELENLSVESLLLIYADFCVKSRRSEDGTETIHFYTLEEAFDVILNKLDNVDEAKRARYTRVYAKLLDFRDYMHSIGVSVSLSRTEPRERHWKDAALLNGREVVERLKYLAIEHNIEVMHRFGSDLEFAGLLEDARSEKQWKNIRAYINTLAEYYTYMTLEQKQMTIGFLRELLINREGDIRRQAALLNGEIIATYDEEYRKELPEDVRREARRQDSHAIWRRYLREILFPDLQKTERQKRWMGYSLKITLNGLLESAPDDHRRQFLLEFLDVLETKELADAADATVFILLDTLLETPVEMLEAQHIERLLRFCERAIRREALEVRVAVLRVIRKLAESCGEGQLNEDLVTRMRALLSVRVADDETASVVFLKVKAREALGLCGQTTGRFRDELDLLEEDTSYIFRSNLKVDTPWTVKAVNIELMLDELRHGKEDQAFYIATHLANLLKVSERVTVRHTAGTGLLELAPLLSRDQKNEIAIELTKGLEIGEYQFSKYIPEYLGPLIMQLHPEELEEILHELQHLLESSNQMVAGVTLDTLGEMLNHYPSYRERFAEPAEVFEQRRERIIGMLLRGMADYHETVSEEAFWVLGQNIFGSTRLTLEQKYEIFRSFCKKMLTLIEENKDRPLRFYNNAAALNHIYRFISDYQFFVGRLRLRENHKAAFFPGTFDPFSLSHKGIVTTIRDMGYEVYLALDEFSWSKNTQARLYRRKIMTMSCASETGVYIFPDEEPINIANADDIRSLRRLLGQKEVYLVVGSDVIANASSYQPEQEPEPDSVLSLNHIVFRRVSQEQGSGTGARYRERLAQITGEVVELTLPTQLEDISSTRIRENIDNNRDISSLIDPVVQNYIYDNSLYLREPQYKMILTTKDLRFRRRKKRGALEGVTITDGGQNNRLIASSEVHQVDTAHLFDEFRDQELTGYIRDHALGKILVIREVHADEDACDDDPWQLILTETLAEALKEDFIYAVYHPQEPCENGRHFLRILELQGFREIELNGAPTGVYAVDMRNPVTIIQNMGTVLKNPFNKNEAVGEALTRAHHRLQESLTAMYPGSLVLSFNSVVMYHKLIRKITAANGVPAEPRKRRRLGPYMCVPFGKILNGMAVPNTVTKTLHMEKSFTPDLSSFRIREYPFYAGIDDQVRTIGSFRRPVILVDDILHKGYRIKRLNPVLRENHIEVNRLIVGLLSGRGKDLMTVQGAEVDSVYFVPNLRAWFVESSQYPFIGGDGVERHTGTIDDSFTAINMILPYLSPPFLSDVDSDAVYHFSMVCLENARDILRTVEEEYQKIFQRKLTLQRLSEAVNSPKLTDVGNCLDFDRTIAASAYVEDDIERLSRMRGILRK
ncbi:MAG: hypothetical protein ACOX41_00520 [Anaerovoracaceae bacterium]|jgi:nicotinic acid mononucleotide adenylyltransferase